MERLLQSIEAKCAEFWLLGESAQTLLFRLIALIPHHQTKSPPPHFYFLAAQTESLLADIDTKIKLLKRNMGWSSFRAGCKAWWQASTWRDLLETSVTALEMHHKRHLYLGIANRTARDFWFRHADHGTCPSLPWSHFCKAYGEEEDMQDIKSFLVSGGDSVHIADFNALAQSTGFPFDLTEVTNALRKRLGARTKLIVNAQEHSTVGIEERLYLAKELAKLQGESIRTLDNTLAAVISYSTNMRRELGADWYTIWANALLPNPVGAMEQDDINLAHEINHYCRGCLLVMHRYMVLWRLSSESFEIFHCVDFPPQRVVRQVIEYLEPLDEANQQMGNRDPKLFAFLRALLQDNDDVPAPSVKLV